MDALIHLVPDAHHAPLFDVAGKPLVLRQIQWLRAAGCERIVIELPPGPLETEVARALDAEPLGSGIIRLPASSLAPRLLAIEPDLGLSSRVLLLPANVLGDGDVVRALLKTSSDTIEVFFDPPSPKLTRLGGACAMLVGPIESALRRVRGPGWGALLRNEDDAFMLSLAILDGAVSAHNSSAWAVQVHASRVSSGVWVARGAEVHDTAHLVRPVFIGAGAVVSRDAVVGPGVLVGQEATVGSCSRLLSAAVSPGAAVPAATDVSGARIVQTLPSPPRRSSPWAYGAMLATLLVALVTTGLVLRRVPASAAAEFSSRMVPR